MSKKIIFSFFLLCAVTGSSLMAQNIFNDTILFDITRIKTVGNNFRYLIGFETVEPAGNQSLTGTITLNMCGCYCDSIWDAWPTEVGGGMTGGTATMDFVSSNGGSGGTLGSGVPRRLRGRLNIWQMPGSFGIPRNDPFTLPVSIRFDP